jgi:thiaminase
MAPCMRLYAFLGATLAVAFPPPAADNGGGGADTPYRSWMDTYASQVSEWIRKDALVQSLRKRETV